MTAHERLLKKLTTNARRVNCAVEVVVYKANGMPEDPSYVLIEGDRDALRFALVCCKHRQKRMIADSRSAPKKLESSVQKRSSLGLYLRRLPCVSQNPPGSSLSDKACYQHPASFSSKFCDTGKP